MSTDEQSQEIRTGRNDSSELSTASRQTLATPPEQKPGSGVTRRLIIAAFWAIIVFFGLPHWIWTTSIHRSQLPLDRMQEWTEGRACDLRYRIPIVLHSSEADAVGKDVATTLGEYLPTLAPDGWHDFHVDYETLPEKEPVQAVHNRSSIAFDPRSENYALHVKLQPGSNVNEMFETDLESWASVLHAKYSKDLNAPEIAQRVAEAILDLFRSEQGAMQHLLQDTAYATSKTPSPLSPLEISGLEKRSTRAFKYASNYHITFSLFAAGPTPAAWEVQDALDQYIAPMLASLSPISTYTVNTQVQLYATFSPSITGPRMDSADGQWKLQQADLSGFINAAEWPLSPSIGSGPTINFVLFVPSEEQRPMVVAETGATSWIIPQWGGVQIFNPSSGKDPADVISAEELGPVMLKFGDQLASLLGLPSEPASVSMRISSLARERTNSLILSASSTLGALARLTLKLTSIAIPNSVALSVESTIRHLDVSCRHIKGGNFQLALEHARAAEEEAEKAFFEPSMVGQVYFPEEHKVAVYVPLLGPMAVPLIMSGIKELRGLRGRTKLKGA